MKHSARGSCVEKSHFRRNDAFKHRSVDVPRNAKTKRKKTNRSNESQYKYRYNQCSLNRHTMERAQMHESS